MGMTSPLNVTMTLFLKKIGPLIQALGEILSGKVFVPYGKTEVWAGIVGMVSSPGSTLVLLFFSTTDTNYAERRRAHEIRETEHKHNISTHTITRAF